MSGHSNDQSDQQTPRAEARSLNSQLIVLPAKCKKPAHQIQGLPSVPMSLQLMIMKAQAGVHSMHYQGLLGALSDEDVHNSAMLHLFIYI